MTINSNKPWHIVYTRFRETAPANGNWVFSRPIVTNLPRWRCPCENRMHGEGEDATKDIESWRYMKSFETKEEAEAALAAFPIETCELLGYFPPLRVWKHAGGREDWEKERGLGQAIESDVRELDPMIRQVEWANERGRHAEPPAALGERL